MFDILSLIPGRKKLTQSGWYSFNAICCSHMGHRPDTRGRGGLKIDETSQTYHCFNCNFKCNFKLGRPLSKNTRKLLNWCGIEEQQIQRWNLESLQHKDLIDLQNIINEKLFDKTIKKKSLNNLNKIDDLKEKFKNEILLQKKLGEFHPQSFYASTSSDSD